MSRIRCIKISIICYWYLTFNFNIALLFSITCWFPWAKHAFCCIFCCLFLCHLGISSFWYIYLTSIHISCIIFIELRILWINSAHITPARIYYHIIRLKSGIKKCNFCINTTPRSSKIACRNLCLALFYQVAWYNRTISEQIQFTINIWFLCSDISSCLTWWITTPCKLAAVKYNITATKDIICFTFNYTIFKVYLISFISIQCILTWKERTIIKLCLVRFYCNSSRSFCSWLRHNIHAILSYSSCIIFLHRSIKCNTIFYFFISYISVKWRFKCNSRCSEIMSCTLNLHRTSPSCWKKSCELIKCVSFIIEATLIYTII